MLNTSGVLAVLDRGVTINWDDGPTLHRVTAQVRYHTASVATTQLIRFHATTRASEYPLAFVQEDRLKVTWTWLEGYDGSSEAVQWITQLSVTNTTEEVVYLDSMDVIRIDNAFSGQCNLGAPPGLWQCALEKNTEHIEWETWSQSTASAGGFKRNGVLLVQPVVSNRTHPPVLLIRHVPSLGSASAELPVEIKLEINGERFERLVAHNRANGTLLGPGVTMVSSQFLIASGDDATELLHLTLD